VIDDLRHLPHTEDAFVILSPGECAIGIAICMALGWLLATFS